MTRAPAPLRVRFWRMLAPAIGAPHECWIWPGHIMRSGYAMIRLGGTGMRREMVHRVAYELAYGPIPLGLTVDHVAERGCTSRACCNPAHLEAVTMRENTLRSATAPAAVNSRRTHCVHGHPLTGANLYVDPAGKRRCRECKNARKRQARARASVS